MARQRDRFDHHVARWEQTFAGFDPEVEGALGRIGAINRHVRRTNAAAFGELGVGPAEYETLHTMLAQPDLEATPALLAEACHVTRAAMTSRLDRLAELGYVTRETDPLDRRRVIVRPTPSGRAVWTKALERAIVGENAIVGVLTEREKTQLNTLLRKIVLGLQP